MHSLKPGHKQSVPPGFEPEALSECDNVTWKMILPFVGVLK